MYNNAFGASAIRVQEQLKDKMRKQKFDNVRDGRKMTEDDDNDTSFETRSFVTSVEGDAKKALKFFDPRTTPIPLLTSTPLRSIGAAK